MKKLALLLALFSMSIVYAQLPASWLGNYQGNLKITTVSGDQIDYYMELDIRKDTDSSYHWTIIYGEDSLQDIRSYTLISKGGNEFIMDEKNSIELPINLINGQLISVFEVQGNLTYVSYRLSKKGIYIVISSSSNRTETGNVDNGETMDNDGVPLVYSYETTSLQKAFLRKTKA